MFLVVICYSSLLIKLLKVLISAHSESTRHWQNKVGLKDFSQLSSSKRLGTSPGCSYQGKPGVEISNNQLQTPVQELMLGV